ncbi:MAG: hypothetical protein SVK08_00595 [Halobacteriota archaeon]|nr:hypothetical protein [Halobacteriota archaeon]
MKIPPKKVKADDCMIYVGRVIQDGKITDPGTPYAVHEGEWVEVFPVGSVQQTLNLFKLVSAATEEQQEEGVKKLEASLTELCEELASHLVGWNWTDNNGDPLPQPHKNPEAIKLLTEDELLWLVSAVRGETQGERKNGSEPSVTLSSTVESNHPRE